MMADPTHNRDADLDDPAWDAVAVTPNNSADLARIPTRALYIGGAGDVKVDMAGAGTAVVFAGLAAGTILPIRVDRVYSTDTTATSVVALY
jgi:hypothetical protein